MKNYVVQDIDEATEAVLRTAFRRLSPPGGQNPCINCGQTANHYALCRWCRESCEHVPISGYILTASGSKQAKSYCLKCAGNLGSLPRGSTILNFCLADNSSRLPCARCGGVSGVELHHWAPRNTFGTLDAEGWPTSWLCRDCHREWHQRMDGYRWHARRTDDESDMDWLAFIDAVQQREARSA